MATAYARELEQRIARQQEESVENLDGLRRNINGAIETTARQRNGDADGQRATDEKNQASSRMLTATAHQNREIYL